MCVYVCMCVCMYACEGVSVCWGAWVWVSVWVCMKGGGPCVARVLSVSVTRLYLASPKRLGPYRVLIIKTAVLCVYMGDLYFNDSKRLS